MVNGTLFPSLNNKAGARQSLCSPSCYLPEETCNKVIKMIVKGVLGDERR